ncbi:Sec14p-like phosphatidylinositol transfer family protein [Klebsormidium nitens]|uniref:Sec14p-like phosphatidylinositol transfer family protein n=1 Tax=Klebsormidium nitens TaxID=105231 RepID=A0A1Y1I6Y4_KLENI|nr:Sec14p-like phosphatidylinositol transfer family protein [Klebsormidium nitens]|eukprot:GAQ86283.1 Sec14p-like phosphatidylinositol transfer family protein [Klebsormidium nitens]
MRTHLSDRLHTHHAPQRIGKVPEDMSSSCQSVQCSKSFTDHRQLAQAPGEDPVALPSHSWDGWERPHFQMRVLLFRCSLQYLLQKLVIELVKSAAASVLSAGHVHEQGEVQGAKRSKNEVVKVFTCYFYARCVSIFDNRGTLLSSVPWMTRYRTRDDEIFGNLAADSAGLGNTQLIGSDSRVQQALPVPGAALKITASALFDSWKVVTRQLRNLQRVSGCSGEQKSAMAGTHTLLRLPGPTLTTLQCKGSQLRSRFGQAIACPLVARPAAGSCLEQRCTAHKAFLPAGTGLSASPFHQRLLHQSERRGALRHRPQAVADVLTEAPLPEQEVREKAIDEVAARLAAEHGSLPTGPNGRDDRDLILWFLRDRKFDVDKAVEKLATAIQWRTDFGVEALTDERVAACAATGKAYLHTAKDKEGRSVVVVVAGQHRPEEFSLEDSQRLCVHIVEQAVANLEPPTEQILGIFDLRGFQQKNTDWPFIKFLVDIFFKYYPKRLGHVLFVDAPFIFRPGWEIVKPWIGKYKELVRFCSAKDVKEYFTDETLPPNFRT